MRRVILTLSCFLIILGSFGQTAIVESGIILAVEDDKVYLDLTIENVSVGDRLQVIEHRGFFTHPVTGEQIPREPEIVAYIQITEARTNYSVGSVSPRGSISRLTEGMEVFLLEGEARDTREFRQSIAVQPMNVSSARGGYLGFYIADLLTEELFNIDKFRVIDRQTLGLQMDEIALTSQGIIDEKEAIQLGRMRGVDYFITGTVYEPDVVEVGTGIPIKGIVSAAEIITGQRLGSEYVSDVRVSQLRAIVNITLRVVDVETGEILFIASEMQQAQGRSQIDLEQGALGGLQLQGGATSFLNTITGQATRAALVNLAGYINGYFDGTIDVRNFRGNMIDVGKVGTRSERRNLKRDKNNANVVNAELLELSAFGPKKYNVTIDRGSDVGYWVGAKYSVFEEIFQESKITGENINIGEKKIGNIKITNTEKNASLGELSLNQDIYKPNDYQFPNAEIRFYKIRRINFDLPIIGGGYYLFNTHVVELRDQDNNNHIHSIHEIRIFQTGVNLKFRISYSFSASMSYFSTAPINWYRGMVYSEYLGIAVGYHHRISKRVELYNDFGYLLRIGGPTTGPYGPYTKEERFIPIILKPGLHFFVTNWLSLNPRLPLLPKPAIGFGLSFHMF